MRIALKRAAALALALMMLLSLGTMNASATDPDSDGASLIIKVGTVSAQPGQTVKIPVSVSGNPGIAGIALKFTLGDVKLQEETPFEKTGIFASAELVGNPEDVIVSLLNNDNVTEENGTILYLNVTAPEDTGEYPIQVCVHDDESNIANENWQTVKVKEYQNGTLKVTKGKKGDVNADGKINGTDIMKVKRYMANSAKYPLDDAEFSRADVNGDKKLNGTDIMRIKRYMANSTKYPLE